MLVYEPQSRRGERLYFDAVGRLRGQLLDFPIIGLESGLNDIDGAGAERADAARDEAGQEEGGRILGMGSKRGSVPVVQKDSAISSRNHSKQLKWHYLEYS